MKQLEAFELAAAIILALEITTASAVSTFGQHDPQKIAEAFGERLLARVSVLAQRPDGAQHLQ